jgi:ABC-type multidrug transport system fused ATPase/permease subunit
MLATVRSVLNLLRPTERFAFWSLVVGRALVSVLDLLGILLVGVVAAIGATQLENASGPTRVFGIQVPELRSTELALLVAAVLAIFIVKAALAISLSRALTAVIAGIEARNAVALATHLLSGSLTDMQRLSRDDMQFALTESIKFTFTGILNNVAAIVVETFLLAIIAVTFFVVDPVVAAFAVAYFALVTVGLQSGVNRVLQRAGTEAAESAKTTLRVLGDTLDTFREVAVLQRREQFLGRIGEARTTSARAGAKVQFLYSLPRYVIETALIVGVVVFVGQQLLTGQLTSGLATLGVFLAGSVRVMGALLPLQSSVSGLKVNVPLSETARALLRELPGLPRALEASTATAASATSHDGVGVMAGEIDAPAAVEVLSVSYQYPDSNATVLKKVSLSIAAGSFAAIIGPSGAGKTTLVEIILGLTQPLNGHVLVDGIDPQAMRRLSPGRISYVPQRPGLVSGTIADNVAIGVARSDIDRDRVRAVLQQAQLLGFIDALPQGIDTPVGKQADAFSGGQVQRIGLARALYVAPRLLVLDEATSALDAATEAAISATLRSLRGDLTVIVIAHRLSTVQRADSVVVLDHGQVIAQGDFASVRRSVPMVADYVKLMSFDDDAEKQEEPQAG